MRKLGDTNITADVQQDVSLGCRKREKGDLVLIKVPRVCALSEMRIGKLDLETRNMIGRWLNLYYQQLCAGRVVERHLSIPAQTLASIWPNR